MLLDITIFLPNAKDEFTPSLLSSPLLSSPLRPLPFPSTPILSPPFPLELGPLNTNRGFIGALEHCKLTQWVWGKALADKRFGAYFSQTVQLWWQHFLLISLRTNVHVRVHIETKKKL